MKIKLLLILLFSTLAVRAVEAVPLDGRRVDTPPKYLSAPRIVYPPQLIATFNYLAGNAVLLLDVDASGVVTRAEVGSTSHPAFVTAALEGVMGAKISPALIGGKPVACRWMRSFRFEVRTWRGDYAGGFPAFTPRQPDQMPPEYACEIPPLITYFCEPAFPRDLLVGGVKGKAEIQFVIDQNGRFEKGEVLSASRPEFGAALLTAAESWTFLPAEKKGVKVKTLAVQLQKFLVGSGSRSPEEERVVKQLRQGKILANAQTLDARLRPIYSVAPKYPLALEKEGVAGEAEVEVIITRTGQAVLPQLVSATRPEFGWAAMTAASQWFFSAPRVKGQPVDVNVRIPFSFSPPLPPPVSPPKPG